MARIDLTGGNEMLLDDVPQHSPKRKSAKDLMGSSIAPGAKKVGSGATDAFTSLFSSSRAEGDKHVKIDRRRKGGIFASKSSDRNRRNSKNISRMSRGMESQDDEYVERKQERSMEGSMEGSLEASEDLSENAEEDKKAQLLLSKEEEENALFKRIFQNKIKQMTCVRQVQYYTMVAMISLIMCGYFTLSYFMVTNLFSDSQQSL